MSFIIGLAVVLILVILITIFRVSTLVSIVKGDSKKRVVTSLNKVQASLLLAFLIFGIIGFFYYSFGGLEDNFILPIASEHGETTDRLFWITMAITCFVFIVTQIFLFGFAYKYQYGEDRKATFYPHNNTLELVWTAVPAVVLALLILSGLQAWTKITGPAPENSEIIEIMGYQYAWATRYPGSDGELGGFDFMKMDATNQLGIDFTDRASFDDFVPREIHVPKGRPVEFRIRARDVIHSVYQPHFRLQMNAVPGMPTRFWFTASKTTAEMRIETGNPDFEYELVCNKICGFGHFGMKYRIVVDEPDDYDKWYASQDPWLKQNSSYLGQVSDDLREAASIASGLDKVDLENSVTSK